jgi:nucleoporin POM34
VVVLWILSRFMWKKYVLGSLFRAKIFTNEFSSFPGFFQEGTALDPYATYTYHGLQLLFTYNTIVAVMPLFRKKDDLSDIPLTPGQRKLLGLAPTSQPPTPGSQYATPPRYAKIPTPLSGSPASRGSYPTSPLSASGSPAGSPFSPSASPLLQKTMAGGGLNGARRSSWGTPSPLGPGASRNALPDTPGTASPLAGKGASVGLNNRWLYEKGRRNSGNTRLYS